MEQILKTLNERFIARYGKSFIQLNKNVTPAAKDENGNYRAPSIVVSGGGGTLIGGAEGVVTLNAPAVVRVERKTMKPFGLIYRVAIPIAEAELATQQEAYFNYLLDNVVAQAVANFKHTVKGDENQLRFGEAFCSYERPGSATVFTASENHEFVEFRLWGNWATNQGVE